MGRHCAPGLRRCVGCARGGHPRRAHHVRYVHRVRRYAHCVKAAPFASGAAALTLASASGGCCVGYRCSAGLLCFGVAAATAIAAFTRPAPLRFSPSMRRGCVSCRSFAAATACWCCPVASVAFAAGRAHHRGRHPPRRPRSFTARPSRRPSPRYCLQPGCGAELPRNIGAAPKPNRLFEPGEEALFAGATGVGAGRGRRCGRIAGTRRWPPLGGAPASRGLATGGASGSTPLMTGVCLL